MSDHRDSYHDILFRNIGRARGAMGWSIHHTAAQIGMKRGTLSAKLHGDSDFRVRELMRLATVLEVSFSELTADLDEAAELHPNGDYEVASV